MGLGMGLGLRMGLGMGLEMELGMGLGLYNVQPHSQALEHGNETGHDGLQSLLASSQVPTSLFGLCYKESRIGV